MKTLRLKNRLCSTAVLALLCGAALTVRADYASTVLGLNPLVYYHLNDTNPVVSDTFANSGSAGAVGLAFGLNQPVHQQGPGAIVAESDTPLYLSGLSQYVIIPGSAAVNPSENHPRAPFSVEVWLNPVAAATGDDTLCPLGFSQLQSYSQGGLPQYGWHLLQDTGGWTIRMFENNGANAIDTSSGAAPLTGAWTHIVAQYDGTNALIYTNGLLAATRAAPQFYGAIHCPVAVVLGALNDYSRFWNGGLDQLAIYTNVLSASDILAHYQNGVNPASTPGSYETLVQADHPIAYYRLNDPAPVFGTPPALTNLGSFGGGWNTTYQPGTVSGVAGPAFAGFGTNNYAVKFNGGSDSYSTIDYIQIPPLTGVVTSNFTFTCWIYNPSLQETTGFGSLLWQRANNAPAGENGAAGIDFYCYGVQNMAMWNDSDYADLPNPPSEPPLGVWSFVAAVWTPNVETIYVNGVPHSFIPQINPHLAHDFGEDPLYLGYDSDQTYVALNASMCEAAIFSNALSSNDVQTLYQASQAPPQVASVTQSPANPVFEGSTVSMTASAFGPGALTYQWREAGSPLLNQTNIALTLNAVPTTASGSYDVVVSNANGAVTSSVVSLTVVAGPLFVATDLPPIAARFAGLHFVLTPVIDGSLPTFQWFKNGSAITGATSPTLNFPSLSAADAGSYYLFASNSFGVTNTSTEALTVVPVAQDANYAQTVIAATPFAYWRFDETSGTNAYDYAGGFDGYYTGNVLNDQPGPPTSTFAGLESGNTSYTFDGIEPTKVNVPPLKMNTNVTTIIALIDPAAIPCAIFNSRNGQDDEVFGAALGNGSSDLQFYYDNEPNSWEIDPGITPTLSSWNFVAMVLAADHLTFYLDTGTGLQSGSGPFNPDVQKWAGRVQIGGDDGYPASDLDGGMDEVAVFNRPLSPQEITNIDYALFHAPLRITLSGLQVSWPNGTLQWADDLTGPWTAVPGSPTSPYTIALTGERKFFRVSAP